MKAISKILWGVAAVTLAGIVLYASSKHNKKVYRLEQIAEEGYEFAEDILFPLKNRRKAWRRSI